MNKRYLFIVSVLLFMTMLCSCSNKNTTVARVEGVNSYRLKTVDLGDDSSYQNRIISADKINGDNYALELSYKIIDKDNADKYLTLYKIDDEGNIVSRTKIEADVEIQNDTAAITDEGILIPLANGNIALIDKDTGKVKRSSQESDTGYVIGLAEIPDGYVVIREGVISKIDKDLSSVASINDYLISQNSDNPFFVENEKYYLELSDGYYNVDFEAGEIKKVLDYSDLPVIRPEPYGKYLVGDQGLFEIDIEKLSLKTLADFNYVNIRPSERSAEFRYFGLDDMHFVKCYSYGRGGAELDMYIYDPTLDYSKVKQIVVGGYGVCQDDSLKQAVYKFNSTHDDYRIFLDEYSAEYGWNNAEEAQAALLKLMKHFNEGKAPDIFYGENFDYGYFGKMGLVCDLMPYMDKSDIRSKLYPSVARTMTGSGHCYSIFSSYQLEGYWGLESVFADGNVSFEDLVKKADTSGIPPVYAAMAYDIADGVIRYPMNMYVAENPGGHVLDKSDICNVIDFAVKYGTGSYEELMNMGKKSMMDGEVLTQRSFVSGFTDYCYYSVSDSTSEHRVLTYLGFPAVRGSVHGIRAEGLCALSDSSRYKDICWEFMNYLLSDEVQRCAVSQGVVPVTSDAVDKMIGYAVNPDSIPEDDILYREYVDSYLKGKAVPAEYGDEYRRILDEVDTVISYDWGVFGIVCEEITSYYTQNKSIDSIADSMQSRLDLYVKENY